MGIRQAAVQELARRELAAREQSRTGTPNIIEEQHEAVSAADRAIIKNLGSNPEQSANYLKRNNPELDTRVWDGRILVKNKTEKDWRVVDPDTGIFSTDILADIGDIGYDVASGIAEGAALVGSGLATGGLGAVAGGAAAGAGSEALRQQLGKWAGVNEEVDFGDVALTGALSGAIPLVPGAAIKGAGLAKGAAKGAAKFLGGIDDKAIAGMTRRGEKAISKMEADTVVPRLERLSERMGVEISDVEKAQAQRVYDIKNQLNIADDDQLEQVFRAEIDMLKNSPNPDGTKIQSIERMIDDIASTKEVRSQIDRIGIDDAQLLRREAFPESAVVEDIASELPQEMKSSFKSLTNNLGGEFSSLYEGKSINTGFMSDYLDDYIAKNIPPNMRQTPAGIKMEGAIRNWFKNTFTINNKGNLERVATTTKGSVDPYGFKAQVSITPEQMAAKGVPRDKFLPQSEAFDAISDRSIDTITKGRTVSGVRPKATVGEQLTGTAGRSLESQVGLPSKISADEFQMFKNAAADAARYGKGMFADIAPKKKKAVAKFAQSMEREMDSRLKAILDDRTLLGDKYRDAIGAREQAQKLFKDEASSIRTLNRAIKGDTATLNQLKNIDNQIGTNYHDMMVEVGSAQAKTASGIKQAKQLTSSNQYAKQEAEKYLTTKDKLYQKLSDKFMKGGKPDAEKTLKELNKYANNDPIISKSIDDLASKYGEGVAKEFKNMVDDVHLSAIFGDSEKTLINNLETGQAENTGRGLLQSMVWNIPGAGAGGAQIGGAIGKAIGAQVPIRKTLRKVLPAYFEKKAAFKELSDSAKKELEKKVINSVLRRRDVIRELSKKMITVDDRG